MSQYKWAILQNGHFYFCYFLKFYFDADPSILLLVTVFLHCGTAIFFYLSNWPANASSIPLFVQ